MKSWTERHVSSNGVEPVVTWTDETHTFAANQRTRDRARLANEDTYPPGRHQSVCTGTGASAASLAELIGRIDAFDKEENAARLARAREIEAGTPVQRAWLNDIIPADHEFTVEWPNPVTAGPMVGDILLHELADNESVPPYWTLCSDGARYCYRICTGDEPNRDHYRFIRRPPGDEVTFEPPDTTPDEFFRP